MKLIDETGYPKFGIFKNEIDEINFTDYNFLSPLGKKITGLKKSFAYKNFQYLGAISSDIIFGVAIADLKFVNTSFVYIYLPKEKKIFFKNLKNPFSYGSYFSNKPETGSVIFESGKSFIKMEMNHSIKNLVVNLKELKMNIQFDERKIEPLRICTKAGSNGWVYVRKTAGSKVTGNIESTLGNFQLDKFKVLGHNDFSMGYMRRETFWNWGFLTGQVDSKNIVSINVSSGVNETEYSENSIWINGKLNPLPQVHFIYDKLNLMKPWKIESNDKSIELNFIPEGNYSEKINALILASNFNQLYGKYNGKIKFNNKFIQIKNIYGYAEDHFAKW